MILNGKTIDLKEDISVEQLLKDYDLNPQNVVVDTVEVISFVGGG